MHVIETLNEGLKREIKIVIPAEDLETRLKERIVSTKSQICLNGFRPGKVPEAHLRKVYGKSLMSDVINSILHETSTAALSKRGETPAIPPEIKITTKKAETIFDDKTDLIFSLEYEVLPQILLQDISSIEVIREVIKIPDSKINEQIKHILSSTRTYTEKNGKAEKTDKLTIAYSGKLADGTVIDGDNDATLLLGSDTLIPGFDNQLIGSKKGDKKHVLINFPKDYKVTHLADKEAFFEVTVKEIEIADPWEVNDKAAKKLGFDSIEQLRMIVQEQIRSQCETVTRRKLKCQIFDALDALHNFMIPGCLVKQEFETVWKQVTMDFKKNGRSLHDENTTEEKVYDKYQKLAERRVRLGLLLSAIGNKAGITVTENELKQAIYTQGNYNNEQKKKEFFEFCRCNPNILNSIRASIFEEKVVDLLLEQVKIFDKSINFEESSNNYFV